jgi:ElaB/YqjD/DUF883 family membrane-anchored ribosome-binding protein
MELIELQENLRQSHNVVSTLKSMLTSKGFLTLDQERQLREALNNSLPKSKATLEFVTRTLDLASKL